MTRKDYIIIARVFRDSYRNACETKQPAESLEAILRTAYSMASELAEDNSRFNGWHFMDVVRGNKPLDSRPPRNDSRTMVHGRVTPERAARVTSTDVAVQSSKKQLRDMDRTKRMLDVMIDSLGVK